MRFNADDFTLPAADIEPDAYTAAAYTGAGIDCKNFEYITFVVNIGTMGSSATIDFEVQDSADNSTYADIDSNSSITQQTQAGTDASDSIVTLVMKTSNFRRYARGKLTVGTAACDVGTVAFLSVPKVGPAA